VAIYAPVTTAVFIHIPCHQGSFPVHESGCEYMECGRTSIIAIVSRALYGASILIFGAYGRSYELSGAIFSASWASTVLITGWFSTIKAVLELIESVSAGSSISVALITMIVSGSSAAWMCILHKSISANG